MEERVKIMTSATLIGDLVGSRIAADRRRLHDRLREVLDAVNHTAEPRTPLRITVGDEYQGTFATVGAAAATALRVRLALLPEADVRHGIGWGEVTVLAEEPRVEDGPGWWAARDAIEVVAEAEHRAATRRRRTAYRRAPGTDGPDPAAVEAALMLRDHVVGGLSDRSLSVLRGLLVGSTQREIAERLDITGSAVSQRVRADGLALVVASDELLREVR